MNELTSYIDIIDREETIAESTVIMSLINLYEKESMLSFVQEGKIMDEATGKDKDENAFVKVIKFLPRLISALFKAIFGKKSVSKETAHEFSVGSKALDKIKNLDPEKREKFIDKLNNNRQISSQGLSFKWDEKLGNIKCVSKVNIPVLFGTVIGALKIIQDISKEFNDYSSTSIKKFTKDCKDILDPNVDKKKHFKDHGLKDVNDGLDSILDVAGYIFGISATITVAVEAIKRKLSKDAINKQLNGLSSAEIAARTQAAKELCDNIQKVANKVFAASGIITALKLVNNLVESVDDIVEGVKYRKNLREAKNNQYSIDNNIDDDKILLSKNLGVGSSVETGFATITNEARALIHTCKELSNNDKVSKANKKALTEKIDAVENFLNLNFIINNEILYKDILSLSNINSAEHVFAIMCKLNTDEFKDHRVVFDKYINYFDHFTKGLKSTFNSVIDQCKPAKLDEDICKKCGINIEGVKFSKIVDNVDKITDKEDKESVEEFIENIKAMVIYFKNMSKNAETIIGGAKAFDNVLIEAKKMVLMIHKKDINKTYDVTETIETNKTTTVTKKDTDDNNKK